MLWRLLQIVRFLASKNQGGMANFTDQYANGYQYMVNVFRGTLTPFDKTQPAIANVAYRQISKTRSDIDWIASIGLRPSVEKFEFWSATLNGYKPDDNDIFADKDGNKWNVLDAQGADLTNSSGVPPTYQVLAQQAK